MEERTREQGADLVELKPCPFCGSTDIKIDKCTARVRCKNCFATSGLVSRYKDKGDKAPIWAWNERYEDAKNDRS